jgi:hypothetical protein
VWLEAIRLLKDEFDFIGVVQERQFKESLSVALDQISPSIPVFIIERSEKGRDEDGRPRRGLVALNRWTRDVCASFPNVRTVEMTPYVRDDDEVINDQHFDRKVYFRIYNAICDLFDKEPSARGVAELMN